MKIGCCLNMVATGEDGTGIEWIEKLKEYGYDYVELPMAQMMALDDEAFEALKARVAAAGLVCETSNNLFPVTMRLTGPVVDMEAILSYVTKAFARAKELGVQYCVFGSGPAKSVPEGFSREEGLSQVEDLLCLIAPIARENGVTIVLEPLNKSEDNLINTFADGVEMAKRVNDPNVKVLVDFYHLTLENEPVQHLIDDGKKFLRHVHFANPSGRVYPREITEADYAPFVEALRQIGYDEHVSCEAYVPDGFETDAPAAREFFRKLLNA